ncbi:MAG: cysteine desulfurase-like protein [Proteobacteria bacterium]|nr:cysteine desulfurase-like protein [Pseudomonadota bacterium]
MLPANKLPETLLDLDAIRDQFPSLAETDNGSPRLYFDNPAGTQVSRRVVERMSECLLHGNANIGGYFKTSELAGALVDDARSAMADFFNAPSTDEVIFGQNMTSLTLHMSRSIGRYLKAGDEIVLSRMDHDANVEPWVLLARDHNLKIRWLPFDTDSFEFDLSIFDEILSERTRLVCVGGASNLTGTINDIKSICAKARDVGAWSYIDAVQSAPHIATDVQDLGCDFLVCSAYKFFGPHQGILWGRREVLEGLDPYKVRPAPKELPWCFEPGTQSHEGLVGTGAAVDYFAEIGAALAGTRAGTRREQIVTAFEHLFEYEKSLAAQLIAGLNDIPGIIVQGITSPDAFDRRVPTVSFTHSSQRPEVIAEALAGRNIFVWNGHNYGLEPAKALGLLESGGVVRIGIVHYNTSGEIDTTLNALEDILN